MAPLVLNATKSRGKLPDKAPPPLLPYLQSPWMSFFADFLPGLNLHLSNSLLSAPNIFFSPAIARRRPQHSDTHLNLDSRLEQYSERHLNGT